MNLRHVELDQLVNLTLAVAISDSRASTAEVVTFVCAMATVADHEGPVDLSFDRASAVAEGPVTAERLIRD